MAAIPRLSSTRLGVKFGSHAHRAEASLGWVLLKEHLLYPIKRVTGDPFQLALAEVQPGEHVDLIAYSTEEAFRHSQAASDGLTRSEHLEMLLRLKNHLIANGRSAALKWVSEA